MVSCCAMKTHTNGKDRTENYTAECKDIYYRTDHGFAICYNINPVVVEQVTISKNGYKYFQNVICRVYPNIKSSDTKVKDSSLYPKKAAGGGGGQFDTPCVFFKNLLFLKRMKHMLS